MNYRHIYHAGNFADIFKHIILTRIIEYFKKKDAAFRIIDTHAAIGIYQLQSTEALKTSEWKGGIQAFLKLDFEAAAKELIEPWLTVLDKYNAGKNELTIYPGSPALSYGLMRKQDRLSLMELHSQDFKTLKKNFGGNFQIKVFHLDGWLALKSQLPCKEKRSIVLIDPPFEQEGEFDRLVNGLIEGYKRSSTSCYVMWYAIKDANKHKNFLNSLKQTNIDNILCCELYTQKLPPQTDTKIKQPMSGCGLAIINPPYLLKDEINILKPYFLAAFARDETAVLDIIELTPCK